MLCEIYLNKTVKKKILWNIKFYLSSNTHPHQKQCPSTVNFHMTLFF